MEDEEAKLVGSDESRPTSASPDVTLQTDAPYHKFESVDAPPPRATGGESRGEGAGADARGKDLLLLCLDYSYLKTHPYLPPCLQHCIRLHYNRTRLPWNLESKLILSAFFKA